jgi:prepilin-type N-terminal cleavage/methylation domain-containing protein
MARGYTRRPRIFVEAAHCAGPLADTKDMTVGTGQAATALSRAWHRARRSRFVRDCSGFTLTELLAVLAILPLVMIAVLSLSEVTTTVGADDGERSVWASDVAGGEQRMTRELRQAYAVLAPVAPATSSNLVDVLVRVPQADGSTPVPRRVIYRCDVVVTGTSYRRCLRYEFAASSGAPAGTPPAGTVGTTYVDRLTNGTATDPVFHDFFYPSGASRPTYIAVTVRVPATGERARSTGAVATYDDGFLLRNLDLVR